MATAPRRVVAALVLADVAALVALRHFPPAAWGHASDLRAWFAAAGPDAVIATLAGTAVWVIALWLAVGLAVTAAAGAPGVVGAVARRVGATMLPRTVRVVLLGSAGLGVLLAPVAAGAAPAPSGSLPAPRWPVTATPAARTPSLPPPTWPSSANPSPSTSPALSTGPASPAGSTAASPTTSPRSRPARSTVPRSAPNPIPHLTATPTASGPARSAPTAPIAPEKSRHDEVVTVHAGDSLWMLAAQRLTGSHPAGHHSTGRVDRARVAAEWPRWYSANRGVLGPDPDLLVPGQVLHVPGNAPSGAPATAPSVTPATGEAP